MLISMLKFLLSLFIFVTCLLQAEDIPLLKANLSRAQPGQYLVTAQNKNYSVLVVEKKEGDILEVHEIMVPSKMIKKEGFSWKNWIATGAKGSSSWLLYRIHMPTGTIQHTFSYTSNQWVSVPQVQNFLTTLLNLNFAPIPDSERKKVGPATLLGPDKRPVWTPTMVVEGTKMTGVPFTAWRTLWPKDGTDLSERTIEVYIPQESDKYPSYFPYWLQISGMLGHAKIHIIDSGNKLN